MERDEHLNTNRYEHYGEYKISDLADELIEETRLEKGYSADMSEVDPFERYRKKVDKTEEPEKEETPEPVEERELVEEPEDTEKTVDANPLDDDFDPFSQPQKSDASKKKDTPNPKDNSDDGFDTTDHSKKKKLKRVGIIALAVVLILALIVGILKVTGLFTGLNKEKLVIESMSASFTGTDVRIGDKYSFDDFSVIATYEGGGSAPLKEEDVTVDGVGTYYADSEQTFVFTSVDDETISATVTMTIPDWQYFSMTKTEFQTAFAEKVSAAGLTVSNDYDLSFEDASDAGNDQFTKVKLSGTENCDKATLKTLQQILVEMTLPETTSTADEMLSSVLESKEAFVKDVCYTSDGSLWVAAEKDNTLDDLATSGTETLADSLDTEMESDSDEKADENLTEDNTGVYIRISNPRQVKYLLSYSDGRSSSNVTVLNIQGISVNGYVDNGDGTYNALIAVTYMVTGNVVDGDPYGYLKLSGSQSGSVSMTGLTKGNYYTKVFTFYKLKPGDYTVTITGSSHTYTSTSQGTNTNTNKTTKQSTTKTTEKNSSSSTNATDNTSKTDSTNSTGNTEKPTEATGVVDPSTEVTAATSPDEPFS